MPTSTAEGLRDFVRAADDAAYVASATAETPRSTFIVDLYSPLAEARRKATVHPTTQASLTGKQDYRTQKEFADVSFTCVLGFDHAQQALVGSRHVAEPVAEHVGVGRFLHATRLDHAHLRVER